MGAGGKKPPPPEAAETVRLALPMTPVAESVAVVVMMLSATPVARPAALMVAIPVAELLQVTDAVTSEVDPSLRVPVAVSGKKSVSRPPRGDVKHFS